LARLLAKAALIFFILVAFRLPSVLARLLVKAAFGKSCKNSKKTIN